MQIYKDILKDILDNGYKSGDRTGTGTIRVFDRTVRFDLSKGFPIVTLKKTYFKGALRELLFFLQGGNNIKDMHESIHKWWMPFTDNIGSLGEATYGESLRSFAGCDSFTATDQIKETLVQLRDSPFGRRHIITSWHPFFVQMQLASKNNFLPPCHMNYIQFFVQDEKLSGSFDCRSQDYILGTPVNWVEHSLLIHIFANILDLEVGEYIWHGKDVHVYQNHLEQAQEILTRDPLPLPTINIKRKLTIEDLDVNNFKLVEDDFELINYQYHPAIKAEMAV